MLKKLFFNSVKVILILCIGQIPMGKSTLGGELINHISQAFGRIQQTATGKKAKEFTERSLSSVGEAPKIDWKKLKSLVPNEKIEEEEREAIKELIEKE